MTTEAVGPQLGHTSIPESWTSLRGSRAFEDLHFSIPPKQRKDTFQNPSWTVTWLLLNSPQGGDSPLLEAALVWVQLFLLLHTESILLKPKYFQFLKPFLGFYGLLVPNHLGSCAWSTSLSISPKGVGGESLQSKCSAGR